MIIKPDDSFLQITVIQNCNQKNSTVISLIAGFFQTREPLYPVKATRIQIITIFDDL
jgi:hypothetical protein